MSFGLGRGGGARGTPNIGRIQRNGRALHFNGNSGGEDTGGALFTADQLKRAPEDPLAAALPARAVMEAKGAVMDLGELAGSEQVAKYLARYGLVLVTNLCSFQLLRVDGRGRTGRGCT